MEKCELCHNETWSRIKSDGNLWLCFRCDENEDMRIKTNWKTDKEYDLSKLDKIIKDMEKRIRVLERQNETPLNYD
jgi:hypothetical protein